MSRGESRETAQPLLRDKSFVTLTVTVEQIEQIGFDEFPRVRRRHQLVSLLFLTFYRLRILRMN